MIQWVDTHFAALFKQFQRRGYDRQDQIHDFIEKIGRKKNNVFLTSSAQLRYGLTPSATPSLRRSKKHYFFSADFF